MSPTGSPGCPPASFLPAAATDPVVFGAVGAVAGAAVRCGAAVVLGPLAMLLAGLEGIGPATRVQVSPPHRKPNTQP
jgi:hypothetical protein